MLALLGAFGCAPCNSAEVPPKLFAVPDFELQDQHSKALTQAKLLGRLTVANFIFTRCPSFCPMLTERMQGLERETQDRPELQFLSVSVDPEYDSSERLRRFIQERGLDDRRWTFATGAVDEVKRVVREGFRVSPGERVPSEGEGFDITHSRYFMLIGQGGYVRGFYRSDSEGLAMLREDIATLSDPA